MRLWRIAVTAGTRPARGPGRLAVGVALVALALVAAGCIPKTGSNAPLDWASEMHYSQTSRSQEPPRLAAPVGAVPVTGREIQRSVVEWAAVPNPAPDSPEALVVGAELFRINCAMCHGLEGRGDGPMAPIFLDSGYLAPPDLTGPITSGRTDGDIFGVVTNGILVMPKFRQLLSPEERWLIVRHVRALQGE